MRGTAEVDAHVPRTLCAEVGAEVERDLRLASDLARGVVAPAVRRQVDPGQEAGIRDPIPCEREVLREQLGE